MILHGRDLRLFTFTVLLTLGCGGGKGRENPVPIPPAIADTKVLKWCSHYGGRGLDSGPTSRENRLFERIAERLALGCRRDSRLRDTARAYGRLLTMSETEVQESDIDQVRFLLAQHGSSDYLIQAFVAQMDDASLDEWIGLIEKTSSEWTHCGVGVFHSGEAGRRVFLGVRRIVSLEPFPVSLLPGSRARMRGRVIGEPGNQVRPFLGKPDGSASRLQSVNVASDGTFETVFSFPKRGRYDIELLVEGERGAETAVLVPVFAGTAPDPFPTIVEEPSSGNNRLNSEDALGHYLSQFRARFGLPPLRRDGRLDAAAASHSMEMAEKRYFGHVSPRFGELGSRLAAQGLRPERFAENVARSRSLFRIHRNLMRSPSHRINAIDPAFSHVGIGIAAEGKDFIATQIFARF